MPGQPLPPRSTRHRSYPLEFSGTDIHFRGNQYYEHKLPGISLGDTPPIHRKMNTQSSTKPVKHETTGLQPTPTALPPTTHQERSIRQDPDDTIDLTLDSSDVKFFRTPDEKPLSSKIPENPRGVPTNPATLAPPLSERTSSDTSTRGLSAGSIILGPTLNLIRDPYDKPRLFIRYTLDFESCLANISARGFIDQIRMAPQW